LTLSSDEIISDLRDDIAETLRRSFATSDIVFCCGGNGGTPDDQTRQAAAQALGVPVLSHPEAQRLIAERCADMAAKGQGSADMTLAENQARVQMGGVPEGAEIAPKPYKQTPRLYIPNQCVS